MQAILPAFVVFAALANHGLCAQQAQAHLYTVLGDTANDHFGNGICGLTDLNGDGADEFCVGADLANNSTGYVRVYSGATGLVVREVPGAAAADQFGLSVAEAGDVNGDGFADLLVGAPGPTTAPGYAELLSGLWLQTGAGTRSLYTFSGKAAGDQYGFSVSDAGDVDKDGAPDLLIGTKRGPSGYVELRSGKTGTVIRTYLAPAGVNNFGQAVDNAGDVDKDGYPDAIVGAGFRFLVMSGKDGSVLTDIPQMGGKSVAGVGDTNNDGHADVAVFHGNSGLPKTIRVFSGKDWTVLHTFTAGSDTPHTTMQDGVGDVNGDGYDDVILGNGGSTTYSVVVHSGKDGSALLSLSGPVTFGRSVRGIGDIDGDKIPDVIVGGSGSATAAGMASVYSSRQLAMASDTHRLTLAQGGRQQLSLDAGTGHGNGLYWIFGSITGTKPGINLLGVHIPLNPDLYTEFSIALTNVAPFTNFRGTLDASGKATAAFVVPPNLPAAPFTLHHAFVVYDTQGRFHLAGNAVPLSLTN